MSRYRRCIVSLEQWHDGYWSFLWVLYQPSETRNNWKYFLVPGTLRNLEKTFKTKKAAIEYARSKGWEEIRFMG